MSRERSKLLSMAVALVLAVTPTMVLAADVEMIERDGKVVEITGLNSSKDCAFATTTGKVGQVKTRKGKLPESFVFLDQYGESHINLDEMPRKLGAQQQKRLLQAIAELIRIGQELEIGVHGCGASARIEKLVSVKLATPATTSAASGGKAADATIAGSFSYPSDYIPEDLQVCAEDIETKTQICTKKHIEAKDGTNFQIAVPAGRYHVYAQHTDPAQVQSESQPLDYRAYYSEFVVCGLNVSCPSHAPVVVKAVSGKTVKAEPHDWYAMN